MTRRSSRTIATLATTAVAALGAGATAQVAGAAGAGAGATSAAAVTSATGAADQAWQNPKIQEHGGATVEQATTASGATTMTDAQGRKVGISLEGAASTPGVSTGDAHVFGGSLANADSAVDRTTTGVRMATIIKSAAAPSSFTYDLDLPAGATLAPQANGAVLIKSAEGGNLGVVRPAWARDANGTSLPTSFTVQGDKLVQHVDHSGAAYPVVADPSIDFGLTSATITLNPKDQRIILSGGGAAAGGLLGALICSGSGPGAALCAVGGAVVGTIVFEAIKEYGVKENCDIDVKIGYFPPEVDDVNRVCS